MMLRVCDAAEGIVAIKKKEKKTESKMNGKERKAWGFTSEIIGQIFKQFSVVNIRIVVARSKNIFICKE